ncbi:hypothetical protein J2752_000372 [Halarchaeum rubridurum]|uniref:Uncharacterized protein n=1 Tax=Halarchaeum rubridurum TaxID=489911 RepID=A0A830FRL8_9EURY|nr:hypothetical protein [Halarchaeum rubridurum]MBP1953491.1 hypothetical protein [Halarchaeum rubridurum]GGM64843.1 hypothetical protein GCM10009017_13670 [Halarchaeum rubridurum]
MSWYAVETLRRAAVETRELLRPVRAGVWLRLALLAVLAGGTSVRPPGVGLVTLPLNALGLPSVPDPTLAPRTLAFLAVALALGFVASVFEFLLVDFVETDGGLRRSLGAHARDGLRLFCFRCCLVVLVVVPLGAFVAGILAAARDGSAVALVLTVVCVPVVGALVVGALAASALTTSFVVPLMAHGEAGIRSGWRTLRPALAAAPDEFGAYLVVRACLGVAYVVAGSIVAGAFALPFALAYGATALGGQAGALAGVVALAIGAVGAACYLVCLRGPATAYLRSHSLLVLDRLDVPYDYPA